MKYLIDKSKRPLYLELYRLIREDIINGVYPYNTKLPSKRNLAEELDISTVTVEHSYAILCDEGYVEARERSGFWVNFKKSDGFASAPKHTETFHAGLKAESDFPGFPLSIISKTVRKLLAERGEILLEKSENAGCDELRGAIKNYLARNKGIEVKLSQIIIGSGSEYLYRIIVELLGRKRVFAIESPSYKKIEEVYSSKKVNYEKLPLTEKGIDSRALFKTNATVLHTTPFRSYPSGVTASASKRHEYVLWASDEKYERYIIEDDYESEFSVSSKPTETLFTLSENDNVIYINTFSKTISPSFRIAYMVLPQKLVPIYENKLGFYSCTVPTFMQYVLAELIENGDFERHINRVRRKIRKKLNGQN